MRPRPSPTSLWKLRQRRAMILRKIRALDAAITQMVQGAPITQTDRRTTARFHQNRTIPIWVLKAAA